MTLTFEQIKELYGMGFTAEQITALTIPPVTIPGGEGEEMDSVPAIGEQADTVTDSSPVSDNPQPVDKPVETSQGSDTLEAIKQEIQGLRQSIQSQNIHTQSMELVNPEDELEKVMAEFIRPTYKKEGY